MNYLTDTIAAIASGLTPAGIGVIRISGPEAFRTADRVMRFSGRRSACDADDHTILHGIACDEGGGEIDEALVLIMRAPRSYTGEDVAELQCHGGPFVMKRILDRVLACGARLAEPGEFTKRAFLSGKMDLSQAEGVMELIEAENESARRAALSSLRGDLGSRVSDIRGRLLYETAYLEAALDDPEHISLEGFGERLSGVVSAAEGELSELIRLSEEGRVLTEGIRTVILGRPNAGKSTLLNLFSGRERAIVTSIPGTTRDTLEERIRLGELLLVLTDTAGLREGADEVEGIGIKRAIEAANEADLIIYVVDGTREPCGEDAERLMSFKDRPVILLLNKSDEALAAPADDFAEKLGAEPIIFSAKSGQGKAELEERIKRLFYSGKIAGDKGYVIANARQREALLSCRSSLKKILEAIENGIPEDLWSVDLTDAYTTLGRITGESVNDELINEIFSKFCMGK